MGILLLYNFTTRILSKSTGEKLDEGYTMKLLGVLNKPCLQHPTKNCMVTCFPTHISSKSEELEILTTAEEARTKSLLTVFF